MQNQLHEGKAVFEAGEPLENAQAAMIMVHGRGASAPDILTLADEFNVPGFAYLAPEAAGNTWYPYPFLAPLEDNEPWLSSALRAVGDVVTQLNEAGFPTDRIMLLGFSQGACLALEYAARHAQRYGGLVGLSGGLIGPDSTPRDYPGSLEGTPVFLGCSDVDPHIPLERLKHTTQVLQALGGTVTERTYPGMGHSVNQDEIDFVRDMMNALLAES
jgi:predicted esterase